MNLLSKMFSSFKNNTIDVKVVNENDDFLINIMRNVTSKIPVNNFENHTKFFNNFLKDNISNLEGFSYKEDNDGKLNIYFEKGYIGYIKGQISSMNDIKGSLITKNKIETEKLLRENNLNTTKSVLFNNDSYDFAKVYVETRNYPLVLKPNSLGGGRGITVGVTAENFDDAWKFAVDACKLQNKKVEILIQDIIEGVESRFLVINHKFQSAVLRIPANVIGDGKSTILELIDTKNLERTKNPYLRKLLIKADEQTVTELKQQELSLDTVLTENEIVFLRTSSNLTQGGDNIEISHLVSDNMKRVAEQSVLAIPGLTSAGVDLLYKSFDDPSSYTLELNTSANYKMHHYPLRGKPRTPLITLLVDMKNNALNIKKN